MRNSGLWFPLVQAESFGRLSAPSYPEGVQGTELLPLIANEGVILAGGLLPDIKGTYFRVGHMGSVNRSDLLATIGAIESGLSQCNYGFEPGSGLRALISGF